MHSMAVQGGANPAYVVKAEDLAALYFLAPEHPLPIAMEWIDRGTDQKLKQATVDMLLRTLFHEDVSPSVERLHRSAGLRALFRTELDRQQFAEAFNRALRKMVEETDELVTAVFENREAADAGLAKLMEAGVSDRAVSMVWRTSTFLGHQDIRAEGHSSAAVAATVAGGGVAGAMLGVAVLSISGVGPVAAAGAIAASAYSSVATFSGIIGATGSAIAKMLTDHDVDGVSARLYEQEIRKGKVFVSVDTRVSPIDRATAASLLRAAGGVPGGAL